MIEKEPTLNNAVNTKLVNLSNLIDLVERSKLCTSAEELAFLAVNDTIQLAHYRQSALWLADVGVKSLSGVVQVESNAPYVHWLNRVCQECAHTARPQGPFAAQHVSAELAVEWSEWLPQYALWVPFFAKDGSLLGALVFAADRLWNEEDTLAIQQWISSWAIAWRLMNIERPRLSGLLREHLLKWIHHDSNAVFWKRRRTWLFLATLLICLFPVRLSILAPAEIVPVNPALIRSPIDGVVREFFVQPNDLVKRGQILFDFEDAPLRSRFEVAQQSLAAAEAEYRQQMQQALSDPKAKSQLALLAARIEEKRAELAYVENLTARSKVLASRDGIVIFDDANEWIGKPVQTGERILRLADPRRLEIEAWVAVADAVPFPDNTELSFYVNASPLKSIDAGVRYMSHEAVQRPDGSYAYRVRAIIEKESLQRIGAKGTARIYGERVPLIYWVLRRPISLIRQTIGR